MISPFLRELEKDLGYRHLTAIQPQHILLEQLQATPPRRRQATLVSHIQKDVAQILGRDITQLPDPQLGFFEMGMDSLMSLELRNRLQVNLGQILPSTLTFEYPTINALAEYFLGEGLDGEMLYVADTETSEDTKVQAQILKEKEQQAILENYLLEQLAYSLQLPKTKLSSGQFLPELLDSLITVEIKNQIEADFQVNVPLAKFFEEINITQLASFVLLQITTSKAR
ncbi:MAG: acyl carrier protein [Nostoc sp. ZfuVER08]|jgi:acyl carrier protein|nr:acyl carrier protein [Nostoc sp. ZfuVER08]